MRAIYSCATCLVAIALATPVWAQESPKSGDDKATPPEIIVTAQKRSERLVEVPLSISVAQQTQLESQQVNTVTDLQRVAPSLEIQSAPGQSVGGGGQIRGVGTQSFNQGAVGSVGIVVDQVSQGNANISDLFDVARVEVLKGPQGTLFGLTTSAGVINIVTNAPEFGTFSGRLRTELSNAGTAGSEYGRQVVQGLLNIPVADNAALRVSGNYNGLQGVERNTLTGKLNDQKSYGGRGRFRWEPTSKLSINLAADYTKVDNPQRDFFTIYKSSTASLTQQLASCGITAGEGNRDYCTTKPGYQFSSTWGASGQVDYQAEPFTLSSITAFRRQKTNGDLINIFSLDPYAQQTFTGPSSGYTNLVTQEFRVASRSGSMVEYTVGAFISSQVTLNNPAPFLLTFATPFGVITAANIRGLGSHIQDDAMAVFGQSRILLGDHFRVILGGRYTGERLGVDYHSYDSGLGSNVRTNIQNVSWKTGLQYEFDRNTVAYGTISRGYKGPQVALPDPTLVTGAPNIIRPEIPMDYELGFKGNFLRGRLTLDLSAFYLDLKDYQGQLCTPNAGGGLTCAPQNISKVASKGIEVNLTGHPTRRLNINAGVIYDAVRYPAGFTGSDGTDLSNRQLMSAPEFKATGSIEYSAPVTDRIEGFISADAVYKSSLRLAASTDPNVIYAAHATIGGRLGVRSGDGRYTVAVFARNLTNNHEPILRYQNFPDGSVGSLGQLLTAQSFRQVGISLDGKF